MEQNTPYPPLMRAPLKTRGVFGLSWLLYKRGFWPMFGLSLLLVGLVLLVFMLVMVGQITQLHDLSITDYNAAAISAYGLLIVLLFVFLGYSFLVLPAFLGVAFLEMDGRMEGRVSTLNRLLRYALPAGFKRLYSTYLAMFAIQVIIWVVISILLGIISSIPLLSAAAKGMDYVNTATDPAWLLGMGSRITLAVGYMSIVALSLIFPVAAHEGKRAFKAVGRGYKLSINHIRRILSACALFGFILLFSFAVCIALALLLAWHNRITAITIGICLWATLSASYYPAFCTALYVDAAARMPDVPDENTAESSAAPLPQAE